MHARRKPSLRDRRGADRRSDRRQRGGAGRADRPLPAAGGGLCARPDRRARSRRRPDAGDLPQDSLLDPEAPAAGALRAVALPDRAERLPEPPPAAEVAPPLRSLLADRARAGRRGEPARRRRAPAGRATDAAAEPAGATLSALRAELLLRGAGEARPHDRRLG